MRTLQNLLVKPLGTPKSEPNKPFDSLGLLSCYYCLTVIMFPLQQIKFPKYLYVCIGKYIHIGKLSIRKQQTLCPNHW